MCVVKNVEDRFADFERSSSSILALSKTGTHLAFYEGLSCRSWAQIASFQFLDAILLESEESKLKLTK